MNNFELTVVKIKSLIPAESIGSPRAWGEAWWTASDLSLHHQERVVSEMLRSYLVDDYFYRREEEIFINGYSG